MRARTLPGIADPTAETPVSLRGTRGRITRFRSSIISAQGRTHRWQRHHKSCAPLSPRRTPGAGGGSRSFKALDAAACQEALTGACQYAGCDADGSGAVAGDAAGAGQPHDAPGAGAGSAAPGRAGTPQKRPREAAGQGALSPRPSRLEHLSQEHGLKPNCLPWQGGGRVCHSAYDLQCTCR